MSDFLAQLSAVPSRQYTLGTVSDEIYDRQLRDLKACFGQPAFVPGSVNLTECLEAISPSIHSLSFLCLLRLEIQQTQKRTQCDIPEGLEPGGNLWKHAIRFLRSFDPIQIRYAGYEWRELVELVASAAQATSKPILAVKAIRDALDRLDTSGIFTSTHLILVKLTLHSASYTSALPILDRFLSHFPPDTHHTHHEFPLCSECTPATAFITDVPGISSKLTYRDHLRFFLYSAMIYMALKRWDQASHCLSIVVASPTANSVSKIMVDAYKKWILANLLGHGKVPAASKMIGPHVIRVLHSLARPYISLAEAFGKGDLRRMGAEIEIGQSVWKADKNTGLVSQLFDAHDKFAIIKLGKTFSALTVVDVLQRAPSCSRDHFVIEEFVASMVMSNALRASLSHSPGGQSVTMLRLSPTAQCHAFREEYIRTKLIKGRIALNTIAKHIAQTDEALELSPENLHFIAKSQKWSGNSEKNGTAGAAEIDEDLMGDGQ
ncbi:putative COP9 subunit 3 [Aspergillus lucknowensis]|uniref:COP9 signalosome complex subunit 3 N-terminal helical repeats domain-containing protein n=1 Tax=Aspergillus lucknowensis TaxID=176173 RepID=A0ABR4L5Z0_9EURO